MRRTLESACEKEIFDSLTKDKKKTRHKELMYIYAASICISRFISTSKQNILLIIRKKKQIEGKKKELEKER